MYAALAAALCALAVAHALTPTATVFPVDDAYISLHSAQVLYSGADRQYLGTPALVGATSPAHVVLTSLLLPFLTPLWAHWLNGWLGALAFACALARLAFSLRAHPLVALLVSITGLIVGEVPHQLLNGLETGWAMAAVSWTLAAALESPVRRRWELPVGIGVLPFVRPELALLSGLLLLNRVVSNYQESADDWRNTQKDLLWTAMAAAPWLLLMFWNTGALVPATVMAKRNYFAEGCRSAELKLESVIESLSRFSQTMGVLVFAAPLLVFNRVGRLMVLYAAGLVFAYYNSFPGALDHYEQRYLYVLLPAMWIGPAAATASRSRVLRSGALIVIGAVLAEAALQAEPRWRQHLRYVNFTRHELAGATTWLNDNIPPASRVLVHDAGYVGFAGRFEIVDLVGLKTPSTRRVHAEVTWPSCGQARRTAVAQIASEARITHLVVLAGWDVSYGISAALSDAGWRVDEQYRGAYRVYRVTPPPVAHRRAIGLSTRPGS